jgi:hypothetical protein
MIWNIRDGSGYRAREPDISMRGKGAISRDLIVKEEKEKRKKKKEKTVASPRYAIQLRICRS